MLGSVKKDGDRGTWLFVVDLPPAADGKRRQKKCRGFPTKKAAEAALSELVGRAQRGPIAEPGRQTLAAYLESWLPGVRVSRTGSTASNYRWVLEAYVLPRIGGLRLAALQPNHLRSLYADLLESGSLGRGRDRVGRGGPLSARTVSLVHRILHRALEDAVSDGLLPRNPAAAVKRPATPKSAAGKVWSADQARRFLTSVAADRLEALWRLELSTGLRRAEAAGLRWSDVDLHAGALSVRVQRTTEGYAVVEREPKTGAGRRLVPLDADVVASLRAWRKRQVEERLAYGPAYEDTGLVFTREDGAGYHPQRLSVMFRHLCEKAGVEAIRFHDLRHTAATLALEAGIHPKVVQERLGHASVQITLDTYSHVQPTIARDAADRIGNYLRGDQ